MDPARTAPCERCDTEIPAGAMACPECGYEHPWGRENRLVVALVSGVALLFSTLATSYVTVIWLGNASRPPFPAGEFATWLAPGVLAVAFLCFAYRRPPRTATGEPVS